MTGARTARYRCSVWPGTGEIAGLGKLLPDQQPGRLANSLTAEGRGSVVVSFSISHAARAEGYAKNTHRFARLIWSRASPDWKFSDATFNHQRQILDNPDHVAVTLSNYRWRLGLERR